MITIDELKTHLYLDTMHHTVDGDDRIIVSAIDAAIAEAKGYLAAFDRDKIFSAEGNERNALLVIFLKDIAVWHLVQLCNVGTDIELRRYRYDCAVRWLEQVQKGYISPDLPILDNDGDGTPDTGGIYLSGSNPKRSQHF